MEAAAESGAFGRTGAAAKHECCCHQQPASAASGPPAFIELDATRRGATSPYSITRMLTGERHHPYGCVRRHARGRMRSRSPAVGWLGVRRTRQCRNPPVLQCERCRSFLTVTRRAAGGLSHLADRLAAGSACRFATPERSARRQRSRNYTWKRDRARDYPGQRLQAVRVDERHCSCRHSQPDAASSRSAVMVLAPATDSPRPVQRRFHLSAPDSGCNGPRFAEALSFQRLQANWRSQEPPRSAAHARRGGQEIASPHPLSTCRTQSITDFRRRRSRAKEIDAPRYGQACPNHSRSGRLSRSSTFAQS